MTSFKEFLAENAQQGFDIIAKLKTVEDLLDMKRVIRAEPHLKKFQDEVAEGKIYNPTVTEAKDECNSLFQRAIKDAVTNVSWYNWDHKFQEALRAADIDIETYVNGGNIKKATRSLEAAKKHTTDASIHADIAKILRLVEAYSYCLDAFKAIKDKIIPGRKPATPNPDAFTSRMGTAHAVATVRTSLLKSITPPLDEFEAQLQAYFEKLLAGIDADVKASGGQLKPFRNPMTALTFQATYDFKAKGWDDKRVYTDLVRRDSADGYAKRSAAHERKTIEETFLHKNALKLSMLLDAKGNLTSIDVLPGSPVVLHNGAGTLTSAMEVKFADGSAFKVRNKVIINTSSSGKSFYQYPTTFHDVILADGKKLDSPSEEKMIKVFGAKNA